MKRLVGIVILLLILLSACAPFNKAIATRVAETITAMPTFTPYPTLTRYPTYTPFPTNTPIPTETPIPTLTPTPVFTRWTSDQVIMAFVDAGLEVGAMRRLTVDDYGFAPMMAIEGTRFFIPSLCVDCGGRILSFDNKIGMDKTEEYYVSLGQSSAMFFSWVFIKDNILVQINGTLPEAKARLYESALINMH